jgi:hypothetical protein
MEIKYRQKFATRQDISDLIGGDARKGVAKSAKTQTISLFLNDAELYSDYFFEKGNNKYCMYTGIGRIGHQDSVDNVMYDLNMEIMTHKKNSRSLLLFERKNSVWVFMGVFELTETHQNVQPDDNGNLRRVFVFHLKMIDDRYSF